MVLQMLSADAGGDGFPSNLPGLDPGSMGPGPWSLVCRSSGAAIVSLPCDTAWRSLAVGVRKASRPLSAVSEGWTLSAEGCYGLVAQLVRAHA
jgi:hypothetical protein